MSNFTMVFYFIPEDFDVPEQPNAFGIAKGIEKLKLKDVKQCFPMEGTYQFRFKYMYGKTKVWMDLKDDECRVPTYNNMVIAKVNRISWDIHTRTTDSTQEVDLLFQH